MVDRSRKYGSINIQHVGSLTMTDVDKYHQLEKINRLFYVKQTIEIEKVK